MENDIAIIVIFIGQSRGTVVRPGLRHLLVLEAKVSIYSACVKDSGRGWDSETRALKQEGTPPQGSLDFSAHDKVQSVHFQRD